ncbi:CaiB/BaiF CoA transferase family protein [Robertmurraya massiliosenegalensis]|uniref:CaiB/BaiF CoA transferase family protein n=1 Tax=Robertmurraya massiliosenegalensis TaxID=1287657 RepID=UPI0005510507|nr:CaiB/BaiF CoA-transferase family protein [Robertmurraya massiliosenegalensis]
MPLTGVRVLDLTRLLPGPYASLLLGDFGADVIKVEEPNSGDYARWYEPKVKNSSTMFHSLNRNKRSITLDLKKEEDKTIFLDLVRTADILLESFRPGVMARLGLSYEDLKVINPKLIYCAITSFGQSGPYKDVPAHDINFLSYSGLLDLQGERERKPIISPVQIGDIGGGSLMATIGILIALLGARKTREGQFVDISMLDGVISWMQATLPQYLTTNYLPKRGESPLSGGKACYQIYETKDGRYLAVGALEHKFWERFCTVIEKEVLIPYHEAGDEVQIRMIEEIQVVIKMKTLSEWEKQFANVDACVTPILTLEEMVNHPQVKHRQMIEEVYHSDSGTIHHIANPIKLSRSKANSLRPAPALGEHNKEIFEELGYTYRTKEESD